MIDFKARLKSKKPQIGTIVSLGMPSISEMVSACGYDWLWIDMEHAPLSLDQVQGLLQGKAANCAGFVRIPSCDEIWIKRVLDMGADGIIVPQVNTVEQAKRAVAGAKYPPLGIRSAGVARANQFGMNFAEYVKEADDKLMVLLQIEHIEAVKNVDEILQVPGVDAIIIGPYDLSASMNKMGNLKDAEVQAAIAKVHDSCKKFQIPIGIFCMQAEHAKPYIEKGYDMVAVGIDSHFLWTAAKASLESLR